MGTTMTHERLRLIEFIGACLLAFSLGYVIGIVMELV